MGPDGGAAAAVSLALSGINHHHLFHIAVTIPVVIGKIHFLIHQLTCFHNHLIGALIVVVWWHVGAVVLVVFTHPDRSYHIERQFKHPVALVAEVITHTTLEASFAEAPLVGNLIEQSPVVLLPELLVLKFNEDDETAAGVEHLLPRHKGGECGVWSVECGMWNVECGVWSVE